VKFLGGQQWKTICHVEAHLMAKDTLGACAGAVGFHYAFRRDSFKQVKVLFHEDIFSFLQS